MSDVVQVIGALFVLAGFAALQFGWWRADSLVYLIANLIGASTLSVMAVIGRDPGFLLLEGVWAIVSAWSIVQKLRGRPVAGAH
jgi:hypothetical protein